MGRRGQLDQPALPARAMRLASIRQSSCGFCKRTSSISSDSATPYRRGSEKRRLTLPGRSPAHHGEDSQDKRVSPGRHHSSLRYGRCHLVRGASRPLPGAATIVPFS